jgi:hypothetical protein
VLNKIKCKFSRVSLKLGTGIRIKTIFVILKSEVGRKVIFQATENTPLRNPEPRPGGGRGRGYFVVRYGNLY